MVIRTKPANAFGQWLLDRFTDRGWESYRQAAEYTGMSHTQLRSYVQGVVPRPPQLERLAAYFKVDRALLEDFLGLTPPTHGSYEFLRGRGSGFDDAEPAVMATAGHETATLDPEDDAALLATADALFFGLVGDLRDMPVRERANVLAVLREIVRRDAQGGRGEGGRARAGGAG